MLWIYGCVTERHDIRLVLLAGAVCIFGCFATANLLARTREAARRGKLAVLSLVTACVFGCSIWTTHFIAQLAYEPGLPVGYDVALTALSLAVGIAIAWLGLL